MNDITAEEARSTLFSTLPADIQARCFANLLVMAGLDEQPSYNPDDFQFLSRLLLELGAADVEAALDELPTGRELFDAEDEQALEHTLATLEAAAAAAPGL